MKKATLLFLLTLLSAPQSLAKKKNVIVEYKKYQAIDLGDLQIDGRIVSPGDITINDQSNNEEEYPLFNRKNFHHRIIEDVNNIR